MGAPSTDVLTALARDQHGAVGIDQLLAVGVTRRWVDNLVRRGTIERAVTGVVVIAGSEATWHRALQVGVLALGAGACVSHEAAAGLHRLDRTPPGAVEFTVLRTGRGRVLPLDVHTTRELPPIDRVLVDGFPTTSATRTVLDLARARVSRDRLAAAMDSAVRLGLTAPAALRARLAARRGPGHWGVRVLDDLLVDAGGHTMLERRFLELVRRAGLPRPATQVIHRRDGRSFARVDFEFRGLGVVVEVSGTLGHTTPAERARDAQRRNELQDVGRKVYEYTWEDVTRRSSFVAASLTARLHDAGWRR